MSIFKLLIENCVLELEVIRIFKEEQVRELREGRSLGVTIETISSSYSLERVRAGNLIATGKASKGEQYENYLKNGGKLSNHAFFAKHFSKN